MLNADATLTEATGSIFVEREGSRIALNKGDSIYESDTISTGDTTTADIIFRDGTKSRLSPNTELELTDFSFGIGKQPSFVLNLEQGIMRTASGEIAKQNPDNFELVTPRATIAVHETEFLSSVSESHESHIVLFIADDSAMVVTREDGQSIQMSNPLELVSFLKNSQAALHIERFSLIEMESIIDNISTTLSENIPQTLEDQGNWVPLGNTNLAERNAEAAAKAEAATEAAIAEAVLIAAAEEEAREDITIEEVAVIEAQADEEMIAAAEEAAAEEASEDTATESATDTVLVASTTTNVTLVLEEGSASETIVDALQQAGITVAVLVIDPNILDTAIVDSNLNTNLIDMPIGTTPNDDITPPTPEPPTPLPSVNFVDFANTDENSLAHSVAARTITVTNEVSGKLAGNALQIASTSNDANVLQVSITSGDNITVGSISDQGVVFGDAEKVVGTNQTITFGGDAITVSGEVTGKIYGDLGNPITPDGSNLTFGGDTIKVDTLTGGEIYGDMGLVNNSNNTIEYGKDFIHVTTMTDGEIYGDYFSGGTGGADDIISVTTMNGGTIYGDGKTGDGGGNDIISIDAMTGGEIYGDSQSNVPGGNDIITITDLTQNSIAAIMINSGGGGDTITITDLTQSAKGALNIKSGEGDDTITITKLTQSVEYSMQIAGGAGNDIIKIGSIESTGKNIAIIGESGTDKITIGHINTASETTVRIDAGAGDDIIKLEGGFTNDSGKITLTGGDGNDTFFIDATDSSGSITFTDFKRGNETNTLTIDGTDIDDNNGKPALNELFNIRYTDNTLTFSTSNASNAPTFKFEALTGSSADEAYNSIKDSISWD